MDDEGGTAAGIVCNADGSTAAGDEACEGRGEQYRVHAVAGRGDRKLGVQIESGSDRLQVLRHRPDFSTTESTLAESRFFRGLPFRSSTLIEIQTL